MPREQALPAPKPEMRLGHAHGNGYYERLPAALAVLSIVRNSLAHAFSLAGVVAAIRFRNKLKESRDAVYIFTAIAIGFAAGVRELGVALILSVLFSATELALWRLDLIEEHTASFRRLLTEEPTVANSQRAGERLAEG